MDAPANILLIRLKSIGDVLFTLPAVNVVRDNFPSARITFLTSQENTSLARGFAAVDEVIAIDRAALRSGNPLKMVRAVFGLLHRLRAGRYSLAVDFQGYGETGWLARLTRAPQRWGSVYHRGRGGSYTRGVWRDDHIHPADWNLSLLAQCGLKTGIVRNEFILPAEALAEAQKFFAANRLDVSRPTLFIQPFTSTPAKDWPLEKFLALARHWQSAGRQVLFGGGPRERVRLEPARAAGFCVSAGVPLLTAAALIKLSALAVGSDTGLLHLAVALGRRVVMLMYANAPGTSHPFQHPDWTVTPPAGRPVAEIQLAAALAACERAFSEPAGNASC
jgi:ADP-heptose:LPS heptosyltransferase